MKMGDSIDKDVEPDFLRFLWIGVALGVGG